MEMPKLIPLPIKTKGKKCFKRVWAWITEVRSWELAENWEYNFEGQCIVIPKGFKFDGASIPRPLWGVLSPIGLLLIPGLIHDFGYRYDYLWIKDSNEELGYKKVKIKDGQKKWDAMFYRVGKKVNGMQLINGLAWTALSTMGCFAWRANRKRNEDEVFPY